MNIHLFDHYNKNFIIKINKHKCSKNACIKQIIYILLHNNYIFKKNLHSQKKKKNFIILIFVNIYRKMLYNNIIELSK